MSLPFSVVAIVSAAVLAFLGHQQAAIPLLLGGVVVGGASVQSLKLWRSDAPTTPFTFVSGGE